MLNRLFIWFYCLDIPVILCIMLMATRIFRLLDRAEIDDILHNTIGSVTGLLWMYRRDQ